jgi:hypothetical protein
MRLEGEDVLANLPCGCRVKVEDDGMHIWPCCDDHRRAHEEAVLQVIEPEGIPVEFDR